MSSASAPTETRPSTPDDPSDPGPRPAPPLGLSGPQVAGSALAAVSAAVAASWLGVAGTVVGAALGSVFGTVGTALYSHSLATGRDAVRRTVRTSRDGRAVTVGARPRLTATLAELPWRRLVLGSAAVLVVALAALTVAEQLTGRPVSGYTGGDRTSGTTVGRVLGGPVREAEPRGVRDTTPATGPAAPSGTAPSGPAAPSGATTPTSPTPADPTGATTAQPDPAGDGGTADEGTDPAGPSPAADPTDDATEPAATTTPAAPTPGDASP